MVTVLPNMCVAVTITWSHIPMSLVPQSTGANKRNQVPPPLAALRRWFRRTQTAAHHCGIATAYYRTASKTKRQPTLSTDSSTLCATHSKRRHTYPPLPLTFQRAADIFCSVDIYHKTTAGFVLLPLDQCFLFLLIGSRSRRLIVPVVTRCHRAVWRCLGKSFMSKRNWKSVPLSYR